MHPQTHPLYVHTGSQNHHVFSVFTSALTRGGYGGVTILHCKKLVVQGESVLYGPAIVTVPLTAI